MNARNLKTSRPHAVLWDMDGTLVNTEHHWMAGQRALATFHGVTWTEADALATVGKPMPVSAAMLREKGIPLSIEEIIDDLLVRVVKVLDGGIPWIPGALELLVSVRDAGIPCALVTMAYKPVALRVAAGAPEGTFQIVVAGDDVQRGKPDPEAYRIACARLGVAPEDCVAVEDTLNGTLSAEAAGAHVLVIPIVVPVPAGHNRSRMSALSSIELDDLRAIADGQVIDTIAGSATIRNRG